jgi:predicted ArsR family transcriptional regulator
VLYQLSHDPLAQFRSALAYLFLGTLAQTKNCVGESSLDPFLEEQKPRISAPVMLIPI